MSSFSVSILALCLTTTIGFAAGQAAFPLDGWKPDDTGMVLAADGGHEPKDSEMLVSLMALDDGSAFRQETIRKFFAGVPDRPWDSRDSLLHYGRRLLTEQRTIRSRIFFIDIYHAWPAYDAGRKGFPIDLIKPRSCAYFDNFRGITSDRIFTFDLGRHIEVSGLPGAFLLPMGRKPADLLMRKRDAQGRLLVRVHFRYTGISMAECAPGEPRQLHNRLDLIRFEIYPTPMRWGMKPAGDKVIATFP